MQTRRTKIRPAQLSEDLTVVVESVINELSSRFSQFTSFEKYSKVITYPDLIKLDLKIFEWLKVEDFKMQLNDF